MSAELESTGERLLATRKRIEGDQPMKVGSVTLGAVLFGAGLAVADIVRALRSRRSERGAAMRLRRCSACWRVPARSFGCMRDSSR